MMKVVLASLLACAAIASGLPSANAQQPVSLGTQGASNQIQVAPEEAAAYNNAKGQATPQAQAGAFEAFLTAYPQSTLKINVLSTLMVLYSQMNDVTKTIGAADRILALDPNNPQALFAEAFYHKASADATTDPAAKQAALDAAAAAAQKGLTVSKPADMTDAAFKTLQTTSTPTFYSAIGNAALNKNDNAAAIDAFKKELASVPVAQTTVPGPLLQDTYGLAVAYYQSKPPDLLSCAFYAARVVDYAPPAMKANFSTLAKYCYKKFHGKDDGYDAVATVAQANLNPPASFAASVTPAPTPAEQIHTIISTTPDLATLATSDKEMVFQYGSPDDAAKVWDTIKGKSFQFPGVLVIESSPTVLKVAVSDDAVQSKTADFTFNMTPPDVPVEPETPSRKATAAQLAAHRVKLAAYKKAVKAADEKAAAVAAATTVGSKVTLSGTYDSYTPNPIMIVMTGGDVILPKATPAAKAPVHHTTHRTAARK